MRGKKKNCSGACDHERILLYRIDQRERIERVTLCKAHKRERDLAIAALEKMPGVMRQSYDLQNRPLGPPHLVPRLLSRLEARMLVEAADVA